MVEELGDAMREVQLILEKILAIIKLVNGEKIVEAKETLLKNKTKREIYELCDGRHTVKEIVRKLDTTQPNVSYHLSTLLESGLILYKDIGGNRFYFKILE